MKITRRGILTAGAIAGGGFVIGTTGIGLFIHTYDRRSLQKDAFLATFWSVISPDRTEVLRVFGSIEFVFVEMLL